MSKIYAIDANALIEAAKNYNLSKKDFSFYWEKLNEMVDNKTLISSCDVFDEIKDEDLLQWCKKHKNMFVSLDKDIQLKVSQLLKDYPSLIKMQSSGNSNADPFLIATAIVNGATIITNERLTNSVSNFHIPDVCKQLNVECINLEKFTNDIFE